MSKPAQAQKQLPLDTLLQTKLVARFGQKILRQGFTAIPVSIQRSYRYVPGEVIDGEIQYMTPTEFVFMTDTWSYWWSNGAKPWPSIKELAEHLGKCPRQVKRYIIRLEDKGFLSVEERFTEEGRQTTNCYNFTPFLQRLLAMLEEMEALAKPLHVVGEGDISDTGRVTFESRRRVTFESPELDEEEADELEAENIRSDSVASVFHVENENKEGNDLPPQEEEKSGTARAKNVYSLEKARKSKRKRHARGATPPSLPDYLQQTLQVLSLRFCDQACVSSRTSLAWMYVEAQMHGMDEIQFAYLMDEARDITVSKTAAGLVKGRNKDGSIAQMPYCLSVLETNVDAWCKRHDEEAKRQEGASLPAGDGVIETEEARHQLEAGTSSEGQGNLLPAHVDPAEETTDPEVSSGQGRSQEAPPALHIVTAGEGLEHEKQVGKMTEAAAEEKVSCGLAAENEQPFIETDNPTAGWSEANAGWHGQGLRDLLGKENYAFEVRPTRYGQWGFVIWQRGRKNEEMWEFTTDADVKVCRQEVMQEHASRAKRPDEKSKGRRPRSSIAVRRL